MEANSDSEISTYGVRLCELRVTSVGSGLPCVGTGVDPFWDGGMSNNEQVWCNECMNGVCLFLSLLLFQRLETLQVLTWQFNT